MFVDRTYYTGWEGTWSELRAGAARIEPKCTVTVHDPAVAQGYDVPSPSQSVPRGSGYPPNPWLRWMSETLAGKNIDLVQFVCHGYMSQDHGALALAESPALNTDPNIARFVGAAELSRFLNNMGAWYLGLTSPPNNYSMYGLRLLADQMARSRPGPVFLHEPSHPEDALGLNFLYSLLYGEPEVPPPLCPSVFLYCHPRRLLGDAYKMPGMYVGGQGTVDEQTAREGGDAVEWTGGDIWRSASPESHPAPDTAADSAMEKYTLARPETADLLRSPGKAPRWLMPVQRYLEQSAASLLRQQSGGISSAAQAGLGQALNIVSNILARQAVIESSEAAGTGGSDEQVDSSSRDSAAGGSQGYPATGGNK